MTIRESECNYPDKDRVFLNVEKLIEALEASGIERELLDFNETDLGWSSGELCGVVSYRDRHIANLRSDGASFARRLRGGTEVTSEGEEPEQTVEIKGDFLTIMSELRERSMDLLMREQASKKKRKSSIITGSLGLDEGQREYFIENERGQKYSFSLESFYSIQAKKLGQRSLNLNQKKHAQTTIIEVLSGNFEAVMVIDKENKIKSINFYEIETQSDPLPENHLLH